MPAITLAANAIILISFHLYFASSPSSETENPDIFTIPAYCIKT